MTEQATFMGRDASWWANAQRQSRNRDGYRVDARPSYLLDTHKALSMYERAEAIIDYIQHCQIVRPEYQTFIIDFDIFERGIELIEGQEMINISDRDADGPKMLLAFYLRLPARKTRVFIPAKISSHDEAAGISIYAEDKGRNIVLYRFNKVGGLVYLLDIQKDTRVITVDEGVSFDLYPYVRIQLEVLTIVTTLINTPRVCAIDKYASRQQRRAAARSGNHTLDSIYRVSWDITKKTVAKISRDPNFHCMPLHFRRGHWRIAEPHYIRACKFSDGKWRQWIEGMWVGHPAFGFKKTYHAPTMGDMKKRIPVQVGT